jgi:uncharacterized damage-inducible protein DinB
MEFFGAGRMTKDEHIDAYLGGINLLQSGVAGLTREQALARPIAGKWSTLEVVAHLADFEPIFADRIKRVLSLDRPLLVAADEQPFVQSLAYHERDLEAEVNLIALTRQQVAGILRTKSAQDLQRAGVHSHAGLVTIEQILTQATRHIAHHVPFIIEKKKALGLAR